MIHFIIKKKNILIQIYSGWQKRWIQTYSVWRKKGQIQIQKYLDWQKGENMKIITNIQTDIP